MFSYDYMNKNNKIHVFLVSMVSGVFPHRGSAIGVVPNRIGRPHVTLVSKDLTKDLNIRHKPNEEPIGFFLFF